MPWSDILWRDPRFGLHPVRKANERGFDACTESLDYGRRSSPPANGSGLERIHPVLLSQRLLRWLWFALVISSLSISSWVNIYWEELCLKYICRGLNRIVFKVLQFKRRVGNAFFFKESKIQIFFFSWQAFKNTCNRMFISSGKLKLFVLRKNWLYNLKWVICVFCVRSHLNLPVNSVKMSTTAQKSILLFIEGKTIAFHSKLLAMNR